MVFYVRIIAKSNFSLLQATNTVKLVYRDHLRDQEHVVFIDRWFYAG